jgi:transcriptional regulator with XRE-family HTH domain
MSKVNFETLLMKRLDLQLEKRFPAISFEVLEEGKLDSFDTMFCLECFSINEVQDMPEEIANQRISAEKYGIALRSYLDRFKQNNHQVYTDDICAEANIQRTHLYKILRGERRPSRDLAIAFCFIFKMTVKESQEHILHLGEQLNEHVKRDYIILFGLRNKRNLDSINEILEHYQERPLIDLQ